MGKLGRAVITGCGRVGTQFLVYLLSLSGCRAVHEHVYHGKMDPSAPDHNLIKERWRHEVFEVSWQAAPFLPVIPRDVTVWHQVRNPFKSLRCWAKHGILSDGSAIRSFVCKAVPECGQGTELDRAVSYLVRWNRLVEGRPRFRVEDIDEDLLARLIASVGYVPDRPRIRFALANASHTTGTCGHGPEDDFTVEQVLRTPDGPAFVDMARRYGYELPA